MLKVHYNVRENSNYDEQTIINTTKNTWQQNRSLEEKTADTKVGKIAERIIGVFIENYIKNLKYLSYDNFRNDNFEKHAPFDALIFSADLDEEILKEFIVLVRKEVSKNEFGTISDKLKKDLSDNQIYTSEIKSTRITNRHKADTGVVSETIILKDDFLEYPKFIRNDIKNEINSIVDYYNFSMNFVGNSKYLEPEQIIKNIEAKNMKDLYFRVHIDVLENIAYVSGFIEKETFLKNLKLKKMKKIGKSENAVYLACPLKYAKNIYKLNMLFK